VSQGIFVTGGAGFIGTHLVRALLADGEPVTVYDNLSIGRRENLPAGAQLVVGDVTDADAVARAMAGHRTVVHLAARVAIRSSFDFAVQDTHTNVVGTAAVMRAATLVGADRVVAASSMAVYADACGPAPIAEDHRCDPISPYGISKLASEQLVHRMAAAAGMGSAVLRFFNTYGPGQALSPYVGVVTIFADALKAGKTPTIFGDGEQCRDFVHVLDVVQALILAVRAPVLQGQTFNVGTGVATSVNTLYGLVAGALGPVQPATHAPAVAGELRYSVADTGRLRAAWGYQPRHLLHTALPAVVREIAARQRG
jgi:UDP-glucose 4-epimerase